jgi:hypothetical protein
MPRTNLPLTIWKKADNEAVQELQSATGDLRRRLITLVNSYLKIKTEVVTESITVPLDTFTDSTVFDIQPTADISITLPDATLVKDVVYFFHRNDGSGFTVTLVPATDQTIEAGTPVRNFQVRAIVSDGTNWLSLYSNSNAPWINVVDAGAVGDGTTDDTAAIQLAVDSLSGSQGTVFFPAGFYLITGRHPHL